VLNKCFKVVVSTTTLCMATTCKEETVGGKHDSKHARNNGMLSYGIFMHTVFQGSPDFAALYKSCIMHVKKHKQYAR